MPKTNPNELISVIIPTFNSARFLSKAIKSALEQSYQNIEILVVDDGSTDETERIVKKWQKKDKRIRYLKHKKQKGLSAARNTGIGASKGKFIAFLDADDIWMEDKLEKQIKKIKKGADLVYSDAILIDEEGKKKKKTLWEEIKVMPRAGKDCLKFLFQKNFIVPASSLILKKEIFKKIGGFDERLRSVEDYDFCLRIVAQGCKISYLNSPTLFYRRSSQQMSSREIKMEFWRIYVLLKFLFSHPFFLTKHFFLVTKRITFRIGAFFIKIFKFFYEKFKSKNHPN